jgi:predicted metalloprotease
MKALSSCLDKIWAREFKAEKLFYEPPKRRFLLKRTRDSMCGMMPLKGAGGTYCGATKTYYVLIKRSDIHPLAASWVAEVVSHEYGHHVQYMTNILDYEDMTAYSAKNTKTKDLLSRRVELQAECFAGVAVNAMRAEMPPWWHFRTLYQGTLTARWVRDHGRLSTQLRWLTRGYESGKPGSCNTWSAKTRNVT